MTYKEAIKTPKGGMVEAKGDQIIALYADQLAYMLCMRAEAIYNWSQKHNVDLHQIYLGIAKKKIEKRHVVIAVMNGLLIGVEAPNPF